MTDHVAPSRENSSTTVVSIPATPAGILTPVPAQSLRDPARFVKARIISVRYGICSKTVFRWADAGFIHRHKVTARTVLFDVAEVEEFIRSARV